MSGKNKTKDDPTVFHNCMCSAPGWPCCRDNLIWSYCGQFLKDCKCCSKYLRT